MLIKAYNKVIEIFSSIGEYLRKFGGAGGANLVNPYHCIQHGQYLTVSDYGDHSIKMFYLEGEIIARSSSKKKGNKDGKFNGPYYCQSTKKDLLMVCDERNHRVQVFELSGKFVTKFGSKGSKSGEFRNPVCTANIGNGRIVVCDTNNSRIQLFDYE